MGIAEGRVNSPAAGALRPRIWSVTPMRLVQGVGAWLAVTVVATLIALAVNYAATLVNRAPIRAHVAQAIKDGSLIIPYRDLEMNVRVGPHQFNDCLVLNMITDERGSDMQRAMSPIHGFTGGASPCESLAKGQPATPADPLQDNYHRYMHGTVAVDTFLTAMFSIGTVRDLFSTALIVFVTGLIVAGAWVAGRGLKRGDTVVSARGGTIAVAGIGLLFFYGLGPYGRSLAHPPTDLVIVAYLWAALLLDFRKLGLMAWVGLHALFGVLTMWFELLHGGLPVGACLVLVAWSPYAWGAEARPMLWRGVTATAAFGAAAIAAYVIKVIVTVAVFGPSILGSFSDSLAERMGPASPMAFVQAFITNAHYVGAGSRILGVGLMLASGVTFVLAALEWRKRMKAKAMDGLEAAVLLGMAFLSIVGWCAVFLPHSTLHAFFMVRICVGLFIAAALLAVVTWRASLAKFVSGVAAMVGTKAAKAA